MSRISTYSKKQVLFLIIFIIFIFFLVSTFLKGCELNLDGDLCSNSSYILNLNKGFESCNKIEYCFKETQFVEDTLKGDSVLFLDKNKIILQKVKVSINPFEDQSNIDYCEKSFTSQYSGYSFQNNFCYANNKELFHFKIEFPCEFKDKNMSAMVIETILKRHQIQTDINKLFSGELIKNESKEFLDRNHCLIYQPFCTAHSPEVCCDQGVCVLRKDCENLVWNYMLPYYNNGSLAKLTEKLTINTTLKSYRKIFFKNGEINYLGDISGRNIFGHDYLFCKDSDDGKNILLKGFINGNSGEIQINEMKTPSFSYEDICISDKLLWEFYCIGNIPSNEEITCPDNSACIDGRCIIK